MMRELPAGWSDMDVDPTLRLLAERAARIAGMPVDAWLERAIRRACPQAFTPPAPMPAAYVEPPRSMAPPQTPLAPSATNGAGAALAELIARARQAQPEPPVAPQPSQFTPPQPVLPQPQFVPSQVTPQQPQFAPPQPQFVPPPMPQPPMAPAMGNVPFGAAEPPTPVGGAHDEDFAGRQPSALERVRESKRRAAAFATEVADWRGHEERPPRFGAPWPTLDENASAGPYVPFDGGADFDMREPLELRNPIRRRRSRRPLIIAVCIALAVALGALGAQKFIAGRFGRLAPSESANLAAPPIGSSPSLPQHTAQSLPLPVPPSSPPAPTAAVPSSPPAAVSQTTTNDNGALLPPALVTPPSSSPPHMAATTPVTPPTALSPTTSVPNAPPPAVAPAEPEAPAMTAAEHPDTPPPLPPRKLIAERPAAATASQQQAEAAAAAAARQAAVAEAPKDPTKLASWLEQRAKTGDPVAEYRLGVLYALGQGVKQDYSHAAQLFKAAANGGVAEAQYNVAVMYSEGMGVQRDPVQAVTWYKKAAEQGNANAAFNLGVAYSNGTGVQQDMPEAARWFRRAAAAGVTNAQFNLGLLYERGEGVPQSLVEAYAWYAAAAARGDQGAAQRRDHIASALGAADLKKAQARATQLQQMIQTSAAALPTQKANAASP